METGFAAPMNADRTTHNDAPPHAPADDESMDVHRSSVSAAAATAAAGAPVDTLPESAGDGDTGVSAVGGDVEMAEASANAIAANSIPSSAPAHQAPAVLASHSPGTGTAHTSAVALSQQIFRVRNMWLSVCMFRVSEDSQRRMKRGSGFWYSLRACVRAGLSDVNMYRCMVTSVGLGAYA